jgi:hypothetical protein
VPAFWIERSYTWRNGEDDAKIENFVKRVNSEISETSLQSSGELLSNFKFGAEGLEGCQLSRSQPQGCFARQLHGLVPLDWLEYGLLRPTELEKVSQPLRAKKV